MDKEYLKQHYENHYGYGDEIDYTFCPYRICPLGAHVDHQHGLVTGLAINYGIGVSFAVNDDGLIQLVSHNFRIRKRFNVKDVLVKLGDWADYYRGAISVLQKHYELKNGINAYIYGELPVGGLSSSAASIISFMLAIAKANGFTLTDEEIIEYSYQAETDFVGMSIGKLDQSSEVLAKKDRLLVLDTNTGAFETVAINKPSKPFKFLIVHCGAERLLASSGYNIRVDECKAAAFIINSYTGVYNKFKDSYLRDVDIDTLENYNGKMPENFFKRAMHFKTENERVEKGRIAWQNGDIEAFGKLVTQSGLSSINLYEAGSDLLIDLCEIMRNIDGVYGTRFMGGGFNGACLAIIDPEKQEQIIANIKTNYNARHPEYADKAQYFICTSENGVGK